MGKTIWNKPISVEELNNLSRGYMEEHLGIEFTEVGDDYLEAKMPVDRRTKQPVGLLHGGASAALGETVGSVASYFCIDREKYYSVGLNIQVNHIGAVREGFIRGRATPLHLGSRTHVWDVRIVNDENKLVSSCKLTVIVLPKEGVR